MQPINQLIGKGGSFFVDDSSTENAYLYVVTTAAVITTLEEEGEVDVMTEQNLTGKTIPVGTVLTPKRDRFIEVVISSGSLEGYRG